MPFTINNEEYLEDISITQEEFYKHLENDADVKTSQPSQYYLETLWNDLLKDNDELVYIPMSSGLSATCSNAKRLAENFEGKVQVVDNLRISVTQKESILEAIELAKKVENKDKNIVVILPDTGDRYLSTEAFN
jgi:fatty acid-binding protein DegV